MIKFSLTKEQEKKLNKWIKKGNRNVSRATTGERLRYCFMPTAIGTIVFVQDAVTGEEINLSDYENW